MGAGDEDRFVERVEALRTHGGLRLRVTFGPAEVLVVLGEATMSSLIPFSSTTTGWGSGTSGIDQDTGLGCLLEIRGAPQPEAKVAETAALATWRWSPSIGTKAWLLLVCLRASTSTEATDGCPETSVTVHGEDGPHSIASFIGSTGFVAEATLLPLDHPDDRVAVQSLTSGRSWMVD